jgi:hypothetical protein
MTAAETTIKSRPILFNGPMVRGLLSGAKSQTRRPVVVKTADTSIGRHMLTDLSRAYADHGFPTDEDGDPLPMERWGSNSPDPAPASAYRNHYLHVPYAHPEDGWYPDPGGDAVGRVYCPLGGPGDLLWVREAAELASVCGYNVPNAAMELSYRAGGRRKFNRDAHGTVYANKGRLFSRAIPSIHMPKWASRITLEIVSVRVERLQDISVEDAKKEGLSRITKDDGRTWKWGIPDRDGLPGTDNTGWPWPDWDVDARKAFARLWDQVYGKTEHEWANSPWVWAVSFRRVESPEIP